MSDELSFSNQGEAGEGNADMQDLIAEYLDRLNVGETLDPQQILADHPGLGHHIIGALREFVDFGAADEAPQVGTLGDYTLRRQIGRGGMGVVYDAWQNSLDRQVALKVLPAGIAADDKSFHRFMREAKTAAKLNHPNVVGVYGMGVEANTPYYAMEFVEGETLAQIVANLRTSEPDAPTPFGPSADDIGFYSAVARAFADAADGLQHAHAKGVVHRDIKPSNLILDGEGRLRILDFGLARLEGQESITVSGDLVGTVQYMSPEQAQVRKIPVDHRTDVYSLGATLYEMLTWRPPFKGRTHQETLSLIIERDPVEPRKLNKHIPKDLDTIVLKCLRKEVCERYGTAEALAQDLKRFARGDPIEARPLTRWQTFTRRVSRLRRKIVLAATILALGLSAAWLAMKDAWHAQDMAAASYRSRVYHALDTIRTVELTLGASAGKPVKIAAHNYYVPFITSGDIVTLGRGRIAEAVEGAVHDLSRLAASVRSRIKPFEAHYCRARGLAALGRQSEALAALDQALALDPTFVPALQMKSLLASEDSGPRDVTPPLEGKPGTFGGWKDCWLAARQASNEGRWPEAEAAFDRLMEWHDNDGEPYVGASREFHLERGLARLENRHFVRAIEDLVTARGDRPRFLEPMLLLGKAYYLSDKEEDAERTFTELYDRAPSKDEAALWIAAACRSLRADAWGLAWARKIQAEALSRRLEAVFLIHRCRFEEAVSAARRAADLAPDDAVAQCIFALAVFYNSYHRGWGDYELAREGLRACERAIALDRENWPAQALLAFAYLREGQHEEARTIIRDLLERAPELPYGYTLQSEAHALANSLDEAVSQAARGVEKDRYVVHAHIQLANCLSARGDAFAARGEVLPALEERRKAIAAFEEAIRLEPGYQWAWGGKAAELSKLGEYDDALRAYRKAFECQHFSPNRHRECGLTLEALGRTQEAMVEYATALVQRPEFFACDERLTPLLLLHPGETPVSPLVELLEILEPDAEAESGNPLRLSMLAILRARLPERRDLLKARLYAEKAVARTRKPLTLAALAYVQVEEDDGAAARKTLEEALTFTEGQELIKRLIERYGYE